MEDYKKKNTGKNRLPKGARTISRLAVLAAAGLLAGILLAGCGTAKLPENFDEAKVKAQAELVLGYLNDNNLESFCQVPMTDKMKLATTVEAMETVVAQYMGNRGAFQEYKSITPVGAKDSDGNPCVTVVAVAQYENQRVTYTVSFNEKLEMIGFFLK